jgi:hypothetical protein
MGANATTFVPAYVSGEVLTAADLSVTNSGIPVFATTVTRDAAFGGTGEKVLAEGQYAYIEATNTTQVYDGAAWVSVGGVIVQMVNVLKTDTFTAATTTFTDITGMSVTITPTSASNKIFVLANMQGSNAVQVDTAALQLVRNSTLIAQGDAAGSRVVCTSSLNGGSDGNVMAANIVAYLDSPATTSATTYKLQGRSNQSANTFTVNRPYTDTNSAVSDRTVSTITVFEVTA